MRLLRFARNDNVTILSAFVLIYSYRLIYEIFPDKIEVLALIHGKRDFLKINLEDRK